MKIILRKGGGNRGPRVTLCTLEPLGELGSQRFCPRKMPRLYRTPSLCVPFGVLFCPDFTPLSFPKVPGTIHGVSYGYLTLQKIEFSER